MLIEWGKSYSVNVKELDAQHQGLTNTINQLHEAITRNEPKEKLKDIFRQLEIYTTEHFATEEKYFAAFNYPEAEEHKKQHEDFRKKIKDLESQSPDKEAEISFALIDFLEDWLIDHVLNTDKKYTRCFNDHGLY